MTARPSGKGKLKRMKGGGNVLRSGPRYVLSAGKQLSSGLPRPTGILNAYINFG